MDPWFVDDDEYIRMWAWLARAPVVNADARCPRVEVRPRPDALRPPGVYDGLFGNSGVVRPPARLRVVEYRMIP